MWKKILIPGIVLTSLFSCEKKEIPKGALHVPEGEYIQGMLDSVPFKYIDTDKSNTFNNAYYYGANQNQINMIRYDQPTPAKSIEIYIQLWDRLDELETPAVLARYSALGSMEVQLIDRVNQVDTMHGPNDDLNYVSSSLSATITGKTNDVLTGVFDARLETPMGRSKQLTNGKFRIKVQRFLQ